jgi:uncharacterized membrane protein
MRTDSCIEIAAPAALVWRVFSDVERWPEWTASVTGLVGLDGPDIAVGKRFEIKQPRMPRLVWTVTEVAPGVSWTWEQRSFGGVTVACHEVAATDGDGTVVRQQLDQCGLLGALIGRLMVSTTRRYLELEARGLKARSEQLRRLDAPTS